MNILIVSNTAIPVAAYGGQERVVWWLGKALAQLGHQVTYLVKKGSECPFGTVLTLHEKKPLAPQIPENIDVVHFHYTPQEPENITKPLLITCHFNAAEAQTFHPNTVFLSGNHAQRHGGSVFVHNGINLEDYGAPMTDNRRMYFHFLGKAAWRVKNVRGAIEIAGLAEERLHIIGGSRLSFRMGLNMLSPHARFHGMVGGYGKNALIQSSKGLLFPTLWHEPFGLSIPESLYFGCPIFGTPYGALPELLGAKMHAGRSGTGIVEAVHSEFGFLSVKKQELAEALREADQYDRLKCQEYAKDMFSSLVMARHYLNLYEQVANSHALHATAPVCHKIADGKLLPLD